MPPSLTTDADALREAYNAWTAAAPLRDKRRRHMRYTYGDQWSDIVEDADGKRMREDELITLSGKRPLTNNLIRQLVKTIVGRYRTLTDENKRYAPAGALGAVMRANALAELDSRALEEFVISGCAVQRVERSERAGGCNVWVDNVDPDRFFTNIYRDPRGHDLRTAGMLHDMTPAEVIGRWGAGEARRRRIFELYDRSTGDDIFGAAPSLGLSALADTDFFRAPAGLWRVIELWRYAPVGDLRRCPIPPAMAWQATWLAPDGTVLGRGASPYGHRSHPFIVKHYPLTDGAVHSFVEDVIDQQRAINRLVVLIDKMMAASAKGVLLFPLDQLPEGVDIAEVARRWATTDGIIPITGRGNYLPQQVNHSSADSGAYQLLTLQLKLFEDISGISDALLGRNVSAATGANLYEAQVRNATVPLADLLDTFIDFTHARDAKMAACEPDAAE